MLSVTRTGRTVQERADHAAFRASVDLLAPPVQPSRADAVGAAACVSRVGAPTSSQDVLDVVAGHAWLSLQEGRTFRFSVSPGTVGVSAHDANRRERTLERLAAARSVTTNLQAVYVVAGVELVEPSPSRVITDWSAKSRSRMFTTVASLDYSGWTDTAGTLCMVTLTLPGDWEALAPDGKTFKRLVGRFRDQWKRAGLSTAGLWKMEFQRRGAPHLHMLLRVPATVGCEDVDDLGYRAALGYGAPVPVLFEDWLSRTWAQCCGADDMLCRFDGAECECAVPDTELRRHLAAGTGVDYSGQKFSDPRRIAAYFLGHSSKHTDGKEYQHVVPAAWQAPGAGPGRFWGFWVLPRGLALVELTQEDFYAVRRVLRHIGRARSWALAVDAARWGKGQDPQLRALVRYPLARSAAVAIVGDARRSSWSFGSRGAITGGTVVVNDGVGLGYDVARYLASR